MIGEIWTYRATKPSDNLEKVRPILIIGNAFATPAETDSSLLSKRFIKLNIFLAS